MKNKHGFTLVEVAIAIVIIALLATVASVAYGSVQRSSRDADRSAKAKVIAEALEKYYVKNGEYPAVPSLVMDVSTNTASKVAKKLDLRQEVLRMPKTPSSLKHSLSYNYGLSNDTISYTASDVSDNTGCQNEELSGCDNFTLTYQEESGKVVTIKSKRNGATDPRGPGIIN